jgi:IclR family pca regulon transcriptional regulator
MRNKSIDKPRYFIKSLASGLRLITVLNDVAEPVTISEIATLLRISKTSAIRLCYTLIQLGFLLRDRKKRYSLTPKILTLGHSYISRLDWRQICQSYLQSLFDEINETVGLSILEGNEILYIVRIRKEEYLPFDVGIGTKLPVHCTAMGKVLMAMGSPETINPILETLNFPPLTVHTIADLDHFIKELEEVRTTGYAINDEELSLGNRAIAAPITNIHGHAFAAICITFPTHRYDLIKVKMFLAPHLMQIAQQMSDTLKKIEAPIIYGN